MAATPQPPRRVSGTDWVAWHAEYDDPESRLSRRLVEVREQLAAALDRAPRGPLRVISACAGQGRDVIPTVAEHPRCGDIAARLVEFDEQLGLTARASAGPNVEVVIADAGVTDSYEGAVPANVALFCGVFGNVTDEDIKRTINTLPSLLAPNAEVLWTRHRGEPDLTPTIRRWFAEAGFEEVAFTPSEMLFAVGTHRLVRQPDPFESGITIFSFTNA